MKLDFQRAYWEEKLLYPDWYVRLGDELQQIFFPIVHSDPQLKAFRHEVYALVAELLVDARLPLAQTGPNLDLQRKPVELIVLHHTEEVSHLSLDMLSAIGLIRQYAQQYLAGDVLGHHVKGQPIWSGHFREGRMAFFAYHWLIRPDGTLEQLLEDAAIGWHAGNWEVNSRSIGIALSGNYEHDTPPLAQIAATAQVIREHYPAISHENVLGHREIRAGITCPGAYFLGGWKETVLNALI